ncbi:CAP domain-containing protein [Virgibacillus flavescens]|uniref:CAP domain-containing protein n=1 Tax=Virgibacillus flavescens TaxID=1611422 RepID=UPI003D34EEDC
MRLLRSIIILSLLAIGGYFLLDSNNVTPREAVNDFSEKLKEKTSLLKSKEVPEREVEPTISLNGEIFQWIGKSKDELTNKLGEPLRKDLSAYGYEWWVYTDQTNQYIQFGILDQKITTIYATGKDLSIEPFHVGQAYQEVQKKFAFSNKITVQRGLSSYTFKLTEEEKKMRPLVKIDDDVFLQFYFDTFTSELSAVRVLSGDVLLKQRPYAIEYRGELPESNNLSDKEWNKIESGMEQQIFSISNVIRNQHGKSKLEWIDSVSEVAFKHSKDMAVNNYFSHYGLNGDGLKERLATQDVFYLAAGENIAAQYTDAPAAMQGWLNSEGHRKALLENSYTHIGVGVYHFYYTQNFIKKP